MVVREYLLKLERNLMVGSGRWVADFTESFWDYPLGDIVFDMAVTATVRPKGFFLSRVAAWLTTPNYYVACFVYSGDPGLKSLNEVLRGSLASSKRRSSPGPGWSSRRSKPFPERPNRWSRAPTSGRSA